MYYSHSRIMKGMLGEKTAGVDAAVNDNLNYIGKARKKYSMNCRVRAFFIRIIASRGSISLNLLFPYV